MILLLKVLLCILAVLTAMSDSAEAHKDTGTIAVVFFADATKASGTVTLMTAALPSASVTFTVTAKTRITKRLFELPRNDLKFADLAVGQKAEVIFDGSNTAEEIVVFQDKKSEELSGHPAPKPRPPTPGPHPKPAPKPEPTPTPEPEPAPKPSPDSVPKPAPKPSPEPKPAPDPQVHHHDKDKHGHEGWPFLPLALVAGGAFLVVCVVVIILKAIGRN